MKYLEIKKSGGSSWGWANLPGCLDSKLWSQSPAAKIFSGTMESLLCSTLGSSCIRLLHCNGETGRIAVSAIPVRPEIIWNLHKFCGDKSEVWSIISDAHKILRTRVQEDDPWISLQQVPPHHPPWKSNAIMQKSEDGSTRCMVATRCYESWSSSGASMGIQLQQITGHQLRDRPPSRFTTVRCPWHASLARDTTSA